MPDQPEIRLTKRGKPYKKRCVSVVKTPAQLEKIRLRREWISAKKKAIREGTEPPKPPSWKPPSEASIVKASAAERGQRDLYFLCKEILHYDDMLVRVHQPICDVYGIPDPTKPFEEQDALHNYLILDPRGTFKTSISIGKMIQNWINFPKHATLRMSGTEVLVKRTIQELRDHLLTNTTLRNLYRKHVPWSKDDRDLAPTEWGTAFGITNPSRKQPRREPTISISSLDSVKSGSHYEWICGDDLVHEKNYQTKELLQKTIDDWNLARNLLNPKGFRELDGTRYDWSDLYGKTIETNKGAWRIHCRPIWTDDKEFALANGFVVPKDAQPGQLFHLFPERWSLEELLEIQADDSYLFSCLPAGAPILMADWSEKPIEEIRAGDGIVGFEWGGKYAGLKRATVQCVWSELGDVIEITTDEGRKLRCTPDHKWLNPQRRGPRRAPYHAVKIGGRLVSVYRPYAAPSAREQRLLDYLGGIIDGEGSVQGSISIHQSVAKNPQVCRKIASTIEELGIPCELFINKPHGIHGEAYHYILKGGRSLKIWLLQHATMGKTQRFHDYLWNRSGGIGEKQNGKGSNSFHKILDIQYIGRQTVYNIQTTTGNYVAYGYASKNCQRLNNPLPASSDHFPLNELIKHTVPRVQYPDTGRMNIFMTWDFALGGEKSDFSCGAVGGWDAKGRLFIIDLIIGRFKPSELIEWIIRFWQKWPVSRVGFEDAGSQRMIEPGLMSRLKTMGLSFAIDWIKHDRADKGKEAKNARVFSLEPLLLEHKLWFHSELPFLNQIYLQFSRFPKFANDDIPDAISRLMFYRNMTNTMSDLAVYGSELYSPSLSWDPVDPELGAGLTG